MNRDRSTPEEKLLKIIENPDSFPAKAKRMAVSFKGMRLDLNFIRRIDLQAVNKALAILCAVITLFLIYDIAHSKISLAKRFENITAQPAVSPAADKIAVNVDVKLNDVLALAEKRNIFTLLPSRQGGSAGSNSASPVELRLVGVLWSDSPQAMIENTKEQKTYFVSPGDKIGDATVKQILQNKVIISSDSEEWELR